MKLLECLETEAFNELITFSLEEVKWVFDQHIYFVPNDKESQVIDEATNIEKWYSYPRAKSKGIHKYLTLIDICQFVIAVIEFFEKLLLLVRERFV